LTRLHSPLPPADVRAGARTIDVRAHDGDSLPACLDRLEAYLARGRQVPLSYHPGWLPVLHKGLRQVPYCLEAVQGGQTRGFVALAYVRSLRGALTAVRPDNPRYRLLIRAWQRLPLFLTRLVGPAVVRSIP
jgi:hypothetical protein